MPKRVQPRTELGHILLRCAEETRGGISGLVKELGICESQFYRVIHGESITLGIVRAIAEYLLPGDRGGMSHVMDWHECAAVGKFRPAKD